MTAATTTARAKEIEEARAEWLAKRSGLDVAHIFLIEHYDPRAIYVIGRLCDPSPPTGSTAISAS